MKNILLVLALLPLAGCAMNERLNRLEGRVDRIGVETAEMHDIIQEANQRSEGAEAVAEGSAYKVEQLRREIKYLRYILEAEK
jgi:hypothetical protein